MHPNPIFRSDDHPKSLAFAADRGFGTLTVNGKHGPLAAHIPFVFNAGHSRVAFHMLRSNPVARAAGPALLAVNGPDGYISPDWYGVPEQVPAELEITGIDATWKLGQNKPEAAVNGAAEALKSSGIGMETAALAALMEDKL